MVFDLKGDIADLIPIEGRFHIGAAHPLEEGEGASGTGLGIGNEGHEGKSKGCRIACGLVGFAWALDGGVFETNQALVIEVDMAEFHDGAGDAGLLHVKLRFGDPSDDMSEVDRAEGGVCLQAISEACAGQHFVGEKAYVVLGNCFVNGCYERVVHGSLGLDVGEEIGALLGIRGG